jgi:hypothetical protein
MAYGMTYNSQLDWWNQPVDNPHRLSISQHCRSDSINTPEYPLQQQSVGCDSGFFTAVQVNDVYQNNHLIPNYWVADSPRFPETPMPFALLSNQPMSGNYTTQCIPSASLPPAAFSKEPLPIDQYSSSGLAAFTDTTRNSLFHNQVLPLSDVPALEYDNNPDGNAYSRRQWTDSPMPDEIDSLAGSGETDDSLENSDPCYAELLRQALMEKKDDHTMLLKDLYEWVRTHSSKAQDPSNKGWQNSVRHNLSMNAVGVSDMFSIWFLLTRCRRSKEFLRPIKMQAPRRQVTGDFPNMPSSTALARLLAIAKTASVRRNAIPIPHRSESRRVPKAGRPPADLSAASRWLLLHSAARHPPLTQHISAMLADDISFASIPSLKSMHPHHSKDSLKVYQPTHHLTSTVPQRCSTLPTLIRQTARSTTAAIISLEHIVALSPISTGLLRHRPPVIQPASMAVGRWIRRFLAYEHISGQVHRHDIRMATRHNIDHVHRNIQSSIQFDDY